MTRVYEIVMSVANYNRLVDRFNRLELAEAKGRMALEDANSRIEQLEDILSAIKDYAASYAEFNPTYERILKMIEEGEGNEV